MKDYGDGSQAVHKKRWIYVNEISLDAQWLELPGTGRDSSPHFSGLPKYTPLLFLHRCELQPFHTSLPGNVVQSFPSQTQTPTNLEDKTSHVGYVLPPLLEAAGP